MLCFIRLRLRPPIRSKMEGSEKSCLARNGRICHATERSYNGRNIPRGSKYGMYGTYLLNGEFILIKKLGTIHIDQIILLKIQF